MLASSHSRDFFSWHLWHLLVFSNPLNGLSWSLWSSWFSAFPLSVVPLSVSSVQLLSCVWVWPHGLQHVRLPCPSSSPRSYSNSCPSSQWCHPSISFSVAPFSSSLQSFPASGSFPRSQFFTSGGQSVQLSASASVLSMNNQDWFLLGLTGWITFQFKGLSRVFSNTTV